MDAKEVLSNLFPHAQILSAIFGDQGRGGILNQALGTVQSAVQTVPQVTQQVTQMVPRTVQAIAPGGIPGIMQSLPMMNQAQAGQVAYQYDGYGNLWAIDPYSGQPLGIAQYAQGGGYGGSYDMNQAALMAYQNGAELYR